jgi:glutamine synthetase
MAETLSYDALTQAVASGEIDTVLVAITDMTGQLVGKRFHARHFVETAYLKTHGCNYLLANDIEMEPVPGYEAANWNKGYGDFVLKPDIATLRPIPWLAGTALVLADVVDHDGQTPILHSPRAMLKQQLSRVEAGKMRALFASELEFYLFDESYEAIHDKAYRDPKTASYYIQDYHIFQTTKEEPVMRAVRNGLHEAGIPVECTKGEWGPGQQEINVRYADALQMADRHVITKNAIKEIAHAHGKAVTFMAKWHYDLAGSSAHIHSSLWDTSSTASLFADPTAEHGMSAVMRHYLAGQLAYARDITFFLAPFINSYKRFRVSTFAPTRAVWSVDNRTAGFRVCGEHSSAIRVECRIGGADLNPYLAFAALLAAGLAGIEQKLEPGPAFVGDAYHGERLREIPVTLREATDCLRGSTMLRAAFGDSVIDHYVHTAEWEQHEYDRRVTDWELRRGFERG